MPDPYSIAAGILLTDADNIAHAGSSCFCKSDRLRKRDELPGAQLQRPRKLLLVDSSAEDGGEPFRSTE
jgi:hypothetical protein